jgi:hypothetical protein
MPTLRTSRRERGAADGRAGERRDQRRLAGAKAGLAGADQRDQGERRRGAVDQRQQRQADGRQRHGGGEGQASVDGVGEGADERAGQQRRRGAAGDDQPGVPKPMPRTLCR